MNASIPGLGSGEKVNTLPRRHFVKALLLTTAYAQIGGWKWLAQFVAPVAADDTVPIGNYTMNLADFPALQADYGSVYLSVPGIPDLIVTRTPGNQFHAVTSVCTHLGCTVNTYDADFRSLPCYCHGSRYNPDGTVLNGPARLPLYRYNTQFDGTRQLTIALVKVGYAIQGALIPVPPGGSPRFSLTFATTQGTIYTVQFKAGLADADWAPVKFSNTPADPAVETSLNGTGDAATVYVDLPPGTGFFMVSGFRRPIG